MPIPHDQLKRLEADLAGREHWVRSLQRHIAGLHDELSAHETIIALGRNPSVLQVIHELHDQPGLGEEIARNPRSFFAKRGVRLPEDATVTVISGMTSQAMEIRVRMPTFEYGIGWSRRIGFYMLSQQPAPESKTNEQ